MKPELLDVVELILDLPDEGLMMGDKGTVVEENPILVEFCDGGGETIVCLHLYEADYLILYRYRAAREGDVPVQDGESI